MLMSCRLACAADDDFLMSLIRIPSAGWAWDFGIFSSLQGWLLCIGFVCLAMC